STAFSSQRICPTGAHGAFLLSGIAVLVSFEPRRGARCVLALHAPRRRGDGQLQLGCRVAGLDSFLVLARRAVSIKALRTTDSGPSRMTQFLLIAAATFASEDLTCISTGALIAAGKIGWIPGVLACLFGIYFGDLLLYFAGRRIGRPLLRRFVAGEKLDRASGWLVACGARVVVLSRFTPGLRLPTYLAAGLLKTRFWTFSFYFLLAAVLWTPVLVGSAALLGKNLPSIGLAGPALVLIGVNSRKMIPGWQKRRRLLGWLRRRIRWEFWSPPFAYIPVVPYILFLGIKHRCLTLFTAAN